MPTSLRPKLQWPRPIHLRSRKHASEPLFLLCESARPAFCQCTSYEYFDRGAVKCHRTSQERWPNNMGSLNFTSASASAATPANFVAHGVENGLKSSR
ncbi:hypothetical protein CY34DRAFT_437065 [Suillus luteus UH-Slu-Lm8-n1]|uniref:Uncharacterized protein n=1 Tax=Suillus luteus UH-Slu-Lm8-n1 TaxID=930992 RepID=A0A0D0BUE2_9AGAM|nr:hypothetical protein CY34DRAFT_437065 [Suillus luteus UH-Slu-Lm8-n1]